MTSGAQNKPIAQSPQHPERQRTAATHGADQQIKTNQDQLVVKQPQDLEHQQSSHGVDHQSKANKDTGAVESNQDSPLPSTTNLSPTFHAANSNVTQTTYNYTYMYGTGVTNAGVGGNDHHESSPNANANRAASEGTSKSRNSGSSRNRQSNDFNAREDDYEESEYLDADTSDRAGLKGSGTRDPGHTRRKFAAEDDYEEDSQVDNYNTGRVSHGSHSSSNLRPNTPRGSHTGPSHPHNPRHASEDNYEDDLQPDNHIAGRVSHTSAPHLNPRLGPSRSNTPRPGTLNHGPGHPRKWQSVNENDFEEPEDFQSGHLGSNVRMFPNPGFSPSRQPNHSNTGLAVSTGLFNFGLKI